MRTVVLEAVRAERVGEDNLRPRRYVGFVERKHRFGTVQVPVHRVRAGGESRRLEHRSRATIQKRHFQLLSISANAVTLLDGTSRKLSVSVMPSFFVASSFARMSRLSSRGIVP